MFSCVEWNLAVPFTGERKDCVRNGGSNWRYAWFSYAGRRLSAGNNLDMNCTRGFSDPQQWIISEIGLFDSTIAHCDQSMHSQSHSENCGPFKLKLYSV